MTQTTNNLKPLTAKQVEAGRAALVMAMEKFPEFGEFIRSLPQDGSRSRAAINILMSIGFTVVEAYQIVMGHDSVEKLADDVYNELRANSAKATA
jgi:hypothetical protein